MALRSEIKNGKVYTYNGNILISVRDKTPTRESVAAANKGKVYQAGKGFTPRKATQRTYTTAPQQSSTPTAFKNMTYKTVDAYDREINRLENNLAKDISGDRLKFNTEADRLRYDANMEQAGFAAQQGNYEEMDRSIERAYSGQGMKRSKPYKSLSEERNKIDTLKNERYILKQETKYNKEYNNSDFNALSGYNDDGKIYDQYAWEGEASRIYRYINDKSQQKVMDTEALATSNGTKDTFWQNLKYINQDEKNMYNYLYNKYGGEKALEYLNSYLNYALDERYYEAATKEAEAFAKENPVAASIVSVPQNVFAGLGSVEAGIQQAKNAITGSEAPINWNTPLMANTYGRSSTARQTVAESIKDPGLRFLYETGMSMADSAASMPLGTTLGPVLLGGAASTATMKEAKANGATDAQAMASGVAAGIFEYVCEKIGMDNLFNMSKPKNIKGLVSNILKQAHVEGSEEVLTSLGNTVADAVIMGDKSAYNRSVQGYIDQGMSKAEAEKLAMQDWASGLAMDYVGGAFSGGVFGAGGSAFKSVGGKVQRAMLDKYAGKKAIDAILGDDSETNFPMIEKYAGVEEARKIENSMRAAAEQQASGKSFAIVTNKKGQQYVKADRQVIKGSTPSAWAKSVENYINDTIRQGKDVQFTAADGDILTITEDTAGKAKFRNEITMPNGKKRLMTDAEFNSKLQAEAQIDELAQVSKKGNKTVPDYKNHSFAKDGFNYRTAYFEDADGQMYRITMSVGLNGDIKTIYNVGKMMPQKKKPSLVAQRPSGKLPQAENFSNINISSDTISVNNNMPDISENDTIKENGGTENENILDGSSGRDIGERAGKQALRVGETAGQIESRIAETEQIKRSGQFREVTDDSGNVAVRFNEIPESMLPEHCREIKEMLSEYGLNTRFSLGPISLTDENGRTHHAGGYQEGNEVVLDASSEILNKYALHELFHFLATNNPQAYKDFRSYIINNAFGAGQFAAYRNRIKALYEGITTDGTEINEEVMANVYAGIYSVENNAALAEAIEAFDGSAVGSRKTKNNIKLAKEINEGIMPPDEVLFEIRYSEAMANPKIKELYNNAKKGDLKAAAELVKNLISKDTIERFKSYGPNVKIVAASASMREQDNVIPIAAAQEISRNTGQEIIDWISKIPENKKSRQTSIWDRMKEPYPEFDITKKGDYNKFKGSVVALVDDNATTGRTFNGLRLFIEEHGGKIIGYYSLTAGHDESEKMAVTNDTWAMIEPLINDVKAFAKKEGIKREITKTGLTEREANELYARFEKAQTGTMAKGNDGAALREKSSMGQRNTEVSINNEETTQKGGFSIAENKRNFAITEDIPKKKRDSMSKANRASLEATEPPAQKEKTSFQEVIKTERDKAREAFEKEAEKVELPKKAQKFFDRIVNAYAKKAFDVMSTLKEDKAGMKADIRIFAEEILRTGKIDNAKLTEIAQRLWTSGVVIDDSFKTQHKEMYQRLKDATIKVSTQIKNDIADYQDYRRSIIGLVKTGNNGVPVDVLYDELNAEDAQLFPADIINPTDQFMRIVQVREMFKPKAIRNAKVQEVGYKDYAVREFARLTSNFLSAVQQAGEYRRAVLEGSEDIGYVDQKRNQEAAKHLGEARKAYAAWKKDNLIDDLSEEKAKTIVESDLSLGDISDKTDSGKTINKRLIEKALPYLRNIKKYEDITSAYKRQQKAKAYAQAKMVTQNSDLWKDKKDGIMYMRETQERNIEDIAGKTDPEGAAMIKRLYIDPVHANEAEKQKFINMLQEKISALKLTGAERLLTQAYGEGLITKQQLEDIAKKTGKIVIKTKSGEVVYEQGFVGSARNVEVSKVENAVTEFREVYDMLIDRANEVLVANGYARIEKLENYFPHFSSEQGIFDTIKKVFFGTDMNIDEVLPEDINGLTHTHRPGKKFFANFLHRKGDKTGLDAYQGFDIYLAGIADVIFHTDDIQNWRALEVVLRNKHTDAETQKRIKDIWNSDLPYNERESQIAGILDVAGKGNLSNYVVNLSEYIGVLAGKKSIFDRPMERALNRRIYSTLQALEGRIASNMLGGNVGSWLTNFIPLVQMNAQVKSKYMLKAMKQTMQSWKNNDGFVYGSDFLTNRRGNNPLSKDVFHKMSDAAMKPMEYIDQFVTEVCCRAVYMEQIAKGYTHEEAMREANERTARVVADRSYGALPTIFNVRNPFAKLFTQFQVEVNNQFSNLFKDIPRRVKEEGVGFLIWALIKYFIGAALFNDLYEKLAGRRPAFDPIGMIKEAYKTYDTTKDAGATATNFVTNAIEQLPFIGGILGGGRVPVSSAIPFSGNVEDIITNITKLASPDVAWEEKKEILNKEVSKPIYYLFFPTAGGAVKKAIEGVKVVAEGGAYSYDAAGNKTVKYAVDENPAAYLQNMIFGTWASPEAQEYILSGFKALSVKSTETFDALKELGLNPTEAFDVVKEISEIQGVEGVKYSKAKNRMEAIDDLDVSDDVKYQLYYDMVLPDSKKEDFDVALNDYGMSKADLMAAYSFTYGVKSDKDDMGKTVSGSKSEKVKAEIDNIEGLNKQQQEFMYETFNVGKQALTSDAAAKTEYAQTSVIPSATNYELPKYKEETINKINAIGVSPYDYSYITERIGAYEDKVAYLKSYSFSDKQIRGLVEDLVMGDTAQDKMLVAKEEYGISNDMYIDAYMYGYSATGTKSERNAQIEEYINGLPLTDKQKTALYDYVKVYKKKEAGAAEEAATNKNNTSKGSATSGRKAAAKNKKITAVSAPKIAIKKVGDATRSVTALAMQNLSDRQKKADYEAQIASIDSNVFMTAAQRAAAKKRLAKQFNM